MFVSNILVIVALIVQSVVGVLQPPSLSASARGDTANLETPYEQLLRLSFPTAWASNVNKLCASHSQFYLESYLQQQPWALSMYSSSGSLAVELIRKSNGNIEHRPGIFDECLASKAQGDDVRFVGQYCTVFFDMKLVSLDEVMVKESSASSTSIRRLRKPKVAGASNDSSNYLMPSVSFCIPSSCSAEELRSAVAEIVGYDVVNDNQSIVSRTDEGYCYTEKKSSLAFDFNFASMSMMAVIGLFILLVSSSTILDAFGGTLWESQSGRLGARILNCFSARKNIQALVTTRADASDNLACLNGIRVITSAWIVLLHVSDEINFRGLFNRKNLFEEVFSLEYLWVTNSTMSVDTFLLISGLLVSWKLLRELDNSKTIDLFQLYFRRYFRLTPLFAFILGIVAFLLFYIGQGPDWNYVVQMSAGCQKSWWSHLLYVNNYLPQLDNLVHNPQQCMPHSWYLAVDMQMFFLSPLFIYPLWRWKRLGWMWVLFAFVACVAGHFASSVIWDLIPTITPYRRASDVPRIHTYFWLSYFQTPFRMPPYFIGIFLGWLLHKSKQSTEQMSKLAVATGWTVAALASFTITFSLLPFLYCDDMVADSNVHARAFYNVFHRPAWAAVVAWVIFACVKGYGGFVNDFLAWKVFVPLSRTTYAVYLTHFVLLQTYFSHRRMPYYFSSVEEAITWLGILMYVFLLSCILTLLVDMPFQNLDKIIFPSTAMSRKNGTCLTDDPQPETKSKVKPFARSEEQ